MNIYFLVCFVHYKKYFFMSCSINPTYKSVYISIYDVDIPVYQIKFFFTKSHNYFYLYTKLSILSFCHLTIKILCISLSIYIYICVCVYLYIYSQTCPCGHLYSAVTCIKRPHFSCHVMENLI